MANQWFCRIHDKKYGPFSYERLQQLAQSGRLSADDLIRCDNGAWLIAGSLDGLFDAPPASSMPTPPPIAAAPPLPKAPPPPPSAPVAPPAPIAAPPIAAAPIGLPVAMPAGPAPQVGIPMGAVPMPAAPVGAVSVGVVPVGAVPGGAVPVGALPVGRPMGIPAGIAVGSVPKPPTFNPTAPTAGSAGGAASGTSVAKKKPKDNTVLLFAGTGGVTAVLLIAVILISSGVIDLSPTTPQEKAAQAAAAAKKPVDNMTPEQAEAAAAALTSGTEEKSPADDAKAKPAETDVVAATDKAAAPVAATPVINVKKWSSPGATLSLKPIRIALQSAWLAANTKGEAPNYLNTVKAAEQEGRDPATAKKRYLFVEMMVNNTGNAAPVTYQGWNGGAGRGPEAVLIVSDDAPPLKPLADDATPFITRLGKTSVAAGETKIDTLVFELPSEDFESVRLALPASSVSNNKNYFGYEIAKSSLTVPEDSDDGGGGGGGNRPADAIPIPGLGGGKPAAAKKKVDPENLADIVAADTEALKAEEKKMTEAEKPGEKMEKPAGEDKEKMKMENGEAMKKPTDKAKDKPESEESTEEEK